MPRTQDLTPIPSNQVAAHSSPVQGGVDLWVLRTRGFAGGAVRFQLLIDGELSAKIGNGEVVHLFLGPGEHVIEVRHPSAHFGAVGDSATLQAAGAGEFYYRIATDLGQIKLLRTTKDSAEGR